MAHKKKNTDKLVHQKKESIPLSQNKKSASPPPSNQENGQKEEPYVLPSTPDVPQGRTSSDLGQVDSLKRHGTMLTSV